LRFAARALLTLTAVNSVQIREHQNDLHSDLAWMFPDFLVAALAADFEATVSEQFAQFTRSFGLVGGEIEINVNHSVSSLKVWAFPLKFFVNSAILRVGTSDF
jgi:hypothetical protein